MPKIFEKIRSNKPKMSAFDLSREKKLSCNMGELIPVYLEEIVPGDQFSVKSEIMMRLAPMVAPVMHRVNVWIHYFFVPNRLVFDEWETLITRGQDGETDPIFPAFNADYSNNTEGSLADYFGIPPYGGGTSNSLISELPFRGYQLIYNEYYRDENLTDEVDLTDHDAITTLRYRCWEKDYFTSALPWPQRGPNVGIPVDFNYADPTEVAPSSGSLLGTALGVDDGPGTVGETADGGTSFTSDVIIKNLETDGVSVDINELRLSSALQRWFERQARGGYRYIETILSHFGVKSSDQRLQRPEYLGGGKQNVMISEVLNTSATGSEPQGHMSGHGIVVGDQNTFKSQFEEHGHVIGIMSVLPRTAYQQGIHRMWKRFNSEDYYWPEFAHLGEQEIKNEEVYWDNNDDTYNDGTFGYQQRYAEYKYGCSSVHGEFRSSLDFYHMGRIFGGQPVLNEDFVEYTNPNGPDERAWAVADIDHLWVQIYHDVKARRPMPYFSDPRLT